MWSHNEPIDHAVQFAWRNPIIWTLEMKDLPVLNCKIVTLCGRTSVLRVVLGRPAPPRSVRRSWSSGAVLRIKTAQCWTQTWGSSGDKKFAQRAIFAEVLCGSKSWHLILRFGMQRALFSLCLQPSGRDCSPIWRGNVWFQNYHISTTAFWPSLGDLSPLCSMYTSKE
jgi:hypothetical protein